MNDVGHSRLARFGVYEVDRDACELRRNGQVVPLQIQPFRVLEALVERAGQVVTRAELRERVWPSTVYVDFDHGLNNAISRLRQALGDSADTPRFIETLPRIGYRFVHALERDDVRARSAPARWRPRTLRMAFGIAAALLGAVTLGVTLWAGDSHGPDREQAVAQRPTANAAAHDAYLRGVALFEQRNKEALRASIEHLERATTLDPDFAEAYAALATDYASAGGNSLVRFMTAEAALGPALAAAKRALELDPNLAAAHRALAQVLNGLQEWSPATDVAIEQSYRRALELDSGSASTLHYYGIFLSTRGRATEAIRQYQRALELEPLSPSINSRLGAELIGLGNVDDGIQYLRKTVELDPWQFNARVRLGWAYLALGDLAGAERELAAAERISPNSTLSLAGLAVVAARTGDTPRARELLDSVQSLAEISEDPFPIALVYVGLEDRENAMMWLSRTVRETRALHTVGPFGIAAPLYDRLRDDPRFAALEREVATRYRDRVPN